MINHVRTLLLNLRTADDGLMEDYIDSSFEPVSLTPTLQSIYDAIFTDNRMTNVTRCQLLLVLLHANFPEDLFVFDPRITYSIAKIKQRPNTVLEVINVIDKLKVIVESVRAALFASDGTRFYSELEKVWDESPYLITRICAALIAYVNRVEKLRTA